MQSALSHLQAQFPGRQALSVRETALLFGWAPKTLSNMLSAKCCPIRHFVVGKKTRRFHMIDLAAYMDDKRGKRRPGRPPKSLRFEAQVAA